MIRPGEYFAPDRSLRPPRSCPDFIPDAKSSVSSQSTLLISRHGFKSLNERQVAAGRTRLAGEQAQSARIENAILTEQHVSPVLIKNSAETSFRNACSLFRRRSRREMCSRGEVQEIVRDGPYECVAELSELKAVRGT
jgi:hypothetical protein